LKHLLLLAPRVPFSEPGDRHLLQIVGHQLQPGELKIPSGRQTKLVVGNQDATPEEFDREALHLEKMIAGQSASDIHLGPLSQGRDPFNVAFHDTAAQGAVDMQ